MEDQSTLKTGPNSRLVDIDVEAFTGAYVNGVISVMERHSDKNPHVADFFKELFAEILNRTGLSVADYPRIYPLLRSYGQINLDNNCVPPFINNSPFSVIEFYMPRRGEGYCVRLSKMALERKDLNELIKGVIKDIGPSVERGLGDLVSKPDFSKMINLPAPYDSTKKFGHEGVYSNISHIDLSSIH